MNIDRTPAHYCREPEVSSYQNSAGDAKKSAAAHCGMQKMRFFSFWEVAYAAQERRDWGGDVRPCSYLRRGWAVCFLEVKAAERPSSTVLAVCMGMAVRTLTTCVALSFNAIKDIYSLERELRDTCDDGHWRLGMLARLKVKWRFHGWNYLFIFFYRCATSKKPQIKIWFLVCISTFLQPGNGRAFHCVFPCKTALLSTPDSSVGEILL